MKKTIVYIIISIMTVYQTLGQSRAMEEKFFPEPNIEIPTPAFQKAKWKGFTKYKEMVKYVNDLTKGIDYITIDHIGESQKGKKIIRIRINKPSDQKKIKVWMQGGLHGNEPASTEGVLYLLHTLINDQNYIHLLDRLDIIILPMANADGYNVQNRLSANGIDLNRDFMKLSTPETNAIRTAFSTFSPQVAIDFHEYNPYRAHFSYFGEKGITTYYDAFFLYSNNLNVNSVIRSTTKDLLVANAKKTLRKNGRNVSDYSSTKMQKGHIHFNQGGSSARSTSTNFALNNCLSVLMEIRGVNLERISFKRRVQTTYLAGMSYLKTAYENGDKIREAIKKANQLTADLEESVVIKQEKGTIKTDYTCIDLATEEKKTIQVVMTDGLQMKAKSTRERPFAYILLPNEEKAIQKLEVLGCKVEKLSTPKTLQVESYEVERNTVSIVKWENIYLRKLKTKTSKISKEFPEGSYVVYLTQEHANVLPPALEPENDNSFFTFRVIDGNFKEGSELPVYRYMIKQKI
ncbi:M14 family zinc carboxypeptidase [Flammeovirga sp. EKP202]|uniref:M14 family zinc carboxypeptidase n=1 Tax=Flammeovirga sp. EKP202 TaxID=2770592 RepID=UPI00165F5AD3|nr:M14 family zinc carboxypeptidase [Flammeovirga sp. EKP202]MBD0404274.1 succinylglutamate desuccinylase/aspartoacylase family protein [Flammeovirga sp. EKP202]